MSMRDEIMKRFNIKPGAVTLEPTNITGDIDDDFNNYRDDTDSEVESVDNNSEVYYLEDNLLSRSFQLCENNDMDVYTIHFCIYSINYNNIPFIKYILENNKTMFSSNYTFPSIKFSCSVSEDIDVYFLNECIKKVMEITNLYEKIDENIVTAIYKGFLEDKNNIYVLFDISNYKPNLKDKYKFAIMDELINVKKVVEIPIDPIVSELFYKNDYLIHLTSLNSAVIEYPVLGYNCRMNEMGGYVNIYNDTNKDSDDDDMEEIYSLEHHILGHIYLFTSKPISSYINNLIRYAIFTVNPKYILRDIGNDTFVNDPNLTKKNIIFNIGDDESEDAYSTVYFHENSIQYWGVKQPDCIFII